jgi:hypothetical protein
VAINIIIVTLPYLLYHAIFEILMNGQSPGKRQMKIKVVRMDGTSATIGNYLMRWLLRLVEVFMLRGALAMITIAASGKGQRLGDLVAGTTVVKLIPHQPAESVFTLAEEDYQPSFNQVTGLNDYDVELIQQALVVNRDYGNVRPVTMLTEKIKSLLNIESDLPPVKFLYIVIKDYSYFTAQK